MRLLVLHSSRFASVGAIRDYLEGLQSHSSHEIYFMEAGDGAVPQASYEAFDAVLVNFCCRLHYGSLFSEASERFVAGFPGLRIVILQDEQENTLNVCAQVARMRPDVLFTTLPPDAWPLVFSADTFGTCRIARLLTGYARQQPLPPDLVLRPLAERPVALGYRVTPHVWRWGELGRLKIEVGRRFHEACLRRGVRADIAWTDDAKIYGDDWLRFNASCRGMLGSESGASIFDWHGDLQHREAHFRRTDPMATCEAFLALLSGQEAPFNTGQVSPRVFEATLTRTALVLVEGEYAGVLKPETHYLPIRRDFSNIDEVLDRLEDVNELEAMAGRAYDHLIGSGAFSYAVMAARIDAEIDAARRPPQRKMPPPAMPVPSELAFLEARPTLSPLGAEHALDKLARFRRQVPDLTDPAQLAGGGPLAIYGAGGGGTMVRCWLEDRGLHVDFFMDSRKTGELDGLPILPAHEVAEAIPDRQVRIVIGSQYFWDISRGLLNQGFQTLFNGNGIIRERISSPCNLFPYDL